MDILWQDLTSGVSDLSNLTHVLFQLLASAILGATIGFEREMAGKSAGLRTHILVALGTCTFVVVSSNALTAEGVSRVIQGIVTGLGFLGAGTILKLSEQHQIKGLTSAAGIWMTAAIGVAVGLRTLGIAIIATVIALVVLVAIRKWEHRKPGETIKDQGKE
jgi:putative Mg2+ transporter-C (MgtC) family protein